MVPLILRSVDPYIINHLQQEVVMDNMNKHTEQKEYGDLHFLPDSAFPVFIKSLYSECETFLVFFLFCNIIVLLLFNISQKGVSHEKKD